MATCEGVNVAPSLQDPLLKTHNFRLDLPWCRIQQFNSVAHPLIHGRGARAHFIINYRRSATIGHIETNWSLALFLWVMIMASGLRNLRAGLHHGPWSRTMEDGLFSWSDFMVWILKNPFTKPLGPSLGVNQMWTKRNDHAPKSKKGQLKKFQVWPLSCLLFTFSFFQKFHWEFNIISFFVMGPCLFLWEHLFASPTAKPVGPC